MSGGELDLDALEALLEAALMAALRNAAVDLVEAARHVDGYRIAARAAMENERDARAEVAALRERVETVLASTLAAHGLTGIVSSREGWIGCDCGAKLSIALDRDGYAEDYEAEKLLRDTHIVDAVRAALATGGDQ